MMWDSYCPTLSAFISYYCLLIFLDNCETTCIMDKFHWHLRQKKPWFINLNCVSSSKKTPILKKSLPLAQEGHKRSCTSQGHCVENQSHCWRIQTSQVWQLKTTTYSYAIHINTCTSNIMVRKTWQRIHKGNFHVKMHHFYVLKFAHLQICELFFLPTNEYIYLS